VLLQALVTESDTVAGPAVRVSPAADVAAFQFANAFALSLARASSAHGTKQLTAVLPSAVVIALGRAIVAQTIDLLLFTNIARRTLDGHGIAANECAQSN